MMAQLSGEETRVLRALAERAMDGYALVSVTELPQDKVIAAVASLLAQGLVSVSGTPQGDDFRKAYFWVPPSVQGKADYLLGKLAL